MSAFEDRSSKAKEKGLEPLANIILLQELVDGDLEEIAAPFVDEEKDVKDGLDATLCFYDDTLFSYGRTSTYHRLLIEMIHLPPGRNTRPISFMTSNGLFK